MATVDATVGGTELAAKDAGEGFTLNATFDFAKTNQLSGDVIQVIALPADVRVLAVDVKVDTAEGGTLTFEVGDGTDPNGWAAAVDGNVAAASQGTGALAASNGGKLYLAADTIDITLNDNADGAKISVFAHCYRLA